MEEQKLTEEAAIEAIAAQIEAQRHRLAFVTGSLFFGAGAICIVAIAADYLLQRSIGAMWSGIVITGLFVLALTLLIPYYKRHRTITLNDRTLMNVWLYTTCINLYVGYIINVNVETATLPVWCFLSVGFAVATAFTSELYRCESANRSNVKGSMVGLNWISGLGAFLGAWSFVVALDGDLTSAYVLALITTVLQLFGTGCVLRHNEHRG